MKIVFTKHSKEMLILRNIKKEYVKSTLTNPDQIRKGKLGKKIYLKDLGKNYLKVIVSVENNNHIVITQYWLDRKRALV